MLFRSGFHNFRIWENRFWSALAGLSFQPFNAGPWYVIRNQGSGGSLNLFKLKEGYGANIFVNNTFHAYRQYKRFQILFTGLWANNIWGQKKGRLGRGRGSFPKKNMRLMDHNAYATTGKTLWTFGSHYSLKKMQSIGLEKNSHKVEDAAELLTHVPKNTKAGTGETMLPKPGSVLIDGGTILPNITGPYLGPAPDIGAYELGLGVPYIGPRTYGPGNLAYGLSEGWKSVPVSSLREYAALGAPKAPASGTAVLLVRENPKAFVLVAFAPESAGDAWKTIESELPLADATAPEENRVIVFFDNLRARMARKGKAVALKAYQVSPNGLWHIVGGCALKDRERVQPELFALVGSMQQLIGVNVQ